jgi:hypothetical protein
VGGGVPLFLSRGCTVQNVKFKMEQENGSHKKGKLSATQGPTKSRKIWNDSPSFCASFAYPNNDD